jgi:hypothetical protein
MMSFPSYSQVPQKTKMSSNNKIQKTLVGPRQVLPTPLLHGDPYPLPVPPPPRHPGRIHPLPPCRRRQRGCRPPQILRILRSLCQGRCRGVADFMAVLIAYLMLSVFGLSDQLEHNPPSRPEGFRWYERLLGPNRSWGEVFFPLGTVSTLQVH